MYGGWLLDVPFSFTGHATDLFRDRCALEDKIRRADFIVCISEFHREFYLKNGARPEQLRHRLLRHRPGMVPPAAANGRPATAPTAFSSGRLVEKKGFAY
jgi:colanic acid/amylovoran biosynthesis glycosyltransferase